MGKVKFARQTKSSREIRRMGQREQNKQKRMEDVQRFWNLSPEERAKRYRDNAIFDRISKNGITIEDVKQAEDKAYQDGYKAGLEATMRMCYAASCLALNELHGFGQKRCKDVLNAIDEKVCYALTSKELVDEVFDRMNLQIEFKDDIPGERVKGA